MKNKLYSSETDEWEKLSIREQVDCLINHLCRGPSGQSSSVQQIRTRIEKTLNKCKEGLPEPKIVVLELVLTDERYSPHGIKYQYKVLDKKYNKERLLSCSEEEHKELQRLQIKIGEAFKLIKHGASCSIQRC